jgi:undecaprenyl-diphosphatase
LVATHFATALVLLLFFLGDWVKIVGRVLRSLRTRELREDDVDCYWKWLEMALLVAVKPPPNALSG